MQPLTKLENKILSWIKDVPQLPSTARKWLGDNSWWIVLIIAIVLGISALFTFFRVMSLISVLGTIGASFYAVSTVTTVGITIGFIQLAFIIAIGLLLAYAVKPLQRKQKKGWVLLFAAWLVMILSIVVGAVLSFDVFSFIVNIIFGAICIAIVGYFLFEIHGQFAHVEKSKGIKAKKKA